MDDLGKYTFNTGAMVLETKLTRDDLKEKRYTYTDENGRDIYAMKLNEDNTGSISRMVNAPTLGADDYRFEKEAVDIIWIKNYVVIFVKNKNYVKLWMKVFEEWQGSQGVRILQFPFSKDMFLYQEVIQEYIKYQFSYDELSFLEVELIGLNMVYKQNEKRNVLKYDIEGYIGFGMMNEDDTTIKDITFIIQLQEWLDKLINEEKTA